MPPKSKPLTQKEKIRLFKEGKSKVASDKRLQDHKRSGAINIGSQPLTMSYKASEEVANEMADALGIRGVIKWVDPQTGAWMMESMQVTWTTRQLSPSRADPIDRNWIEQAKRKLLESIHPPPPVPPKAKRETAPKKPSQKKVNHSQGGCVAAVRKFFEGRPKKSFTTRQVVTQINKGEKVSWSESAPYKAMGALYKEGFLTRVEKEGRDNGLKKRKLFFYQLKS